ncbi:MAG: hypothetical protein FD189_1565 [Elusimicrobia bacterium]|nr:MAG: hypothetical protein FD154_1800 [Elusimicrobiota bacterium]KAF0155054.1 MAG: hypothetical protein FD189_1565 [Elusimicrobiota bacterium]
MDKYLKANLKSWNARVPAHAASSKSLPLLFSLKAFRK